MSATTDGSATCSTSPTASSAGRTTASRSRRSSAREPRHRGAGLRRARSSRCRRPSRRASASGSSSTTARASPTPAPSTPTSRRDARRGARQRRASPRPTSSSAWPSPTASPCPSSTCSGRRSPTSRPSDKVDLALELERAVQAADPRITGVESAEYVDAHGRGGAWSPPPASARRAASTACYVATYCLADRGRRDPDRLRLLGRPRARRPRPRRSPPPTPAERATRLLGATKPPSARRHRRARPVRHRAAPRHPRRHARRARPC